MSPHDENARRPPLVCVPSAEVLEARELLSAVGPTSIPGPAFPRHGGAAALASDLIPFGQDAFERSAGHEDWYRSSAAPFVLNDRPG
jgi:hypothetical protein